MNIFINNNNFLSKYIRLICFGLNLELKPREMLLLEFIARVRKFSKKEKFSLAAQLKTSPQSIANTIKTLKSYRLIRKVKITDKEEAKRLSASYYYECTFSTPKTSSDLNQYKIIINFIEEK